MKAYICDRCGVTVSQGEETDKKYGFRPLLKGDNLPRQFDLSATPKNGVFDVCEQCWKDVFKQFGIELDKVEGEGDGETAPETVGMYGSMRGGAV